MSASKVNTPVPAAADIQGRHHQGLPCMLRDCILVGLGTVSL